MWTVWHSADCRIHRSPNSSVLFRIFGRFMVKFFQSSPNRRMFTMEFRHQIFSQNEVLIFFFSFYAIITYVMAIVELQQHVLAVYNSKSPISEWCHHVNCSQFGIRQIVNGIHVLYVPMWNKWKIVLLNWHLWHEIQEIVQKMSVTRLTSSVFKQRALAGARGSNAATKSQTLILPSYAPLTMRFESKRMQRTSSSWPSRTRRHAPHSMSQRLCVKSRRHKYNEIDLLKI